MEFNKVNMIQVDIIISKNQVLQIYRIAENSQREKFSEISEKKTKISENIFPNIIFRD